MSAKTCGGKVSETITRTIDLRVEKGMLDS